MKFYLLFVFLLSSCESKEVASPAQNMSSTYSKQSTHIENTSIEKPTFVRLMTYNVENLFDTQDDPGKEDETYLPVKVKKSNSKIIKKCRSLHKKWWREECMKMNWDKKALTQKMKRLAHVIEMSHSKNGPDLLFLQEVENKSVLERLNNNYLRKMNYNSYLVEGPDKRGIDTAILSRLKPYGSPKIHLQRSHLGKRTKATRGILQVNFELAPGEVLSAFSIHFPSQGSPTKARQQAIQRLLEIIKKLPKSHMVVVGGDFNITAIEEKKEKLFFGLSQQMLVSHIVGCQSCRGTHYYHRKRSWSFLDALLFSNHFQKSTTSNNWILDRDSINVFNKSSYQKNKYGSPAKFDLGRHKSGVSDHWPLTAVIKKK